MWNLLKFWPRDRVEWLFTIVCWALVLLYRLTR